MTAPGFGLHLNYEGVEGIASQLDKAANDLVERSEFMDGVVKKSVAQWGGNAGDSFRAREAQWKVDINNVSGSLVRLASAIRLSSANQQAADRPI